MSSILTVPAPLQTLFAYFPLYTHPAISPPSRSASSTPTIWIRPPLSQTDLLSGDVECLKWQAYLALRGLTDVAVRWDVSPDGGIDGRLPNLHVPVVTGIGAKTLLAPQDIPAWVDSVLGERNDLEGYQSQQEKDESLAWVALLEGNVRAALVVNEPEHSFMQSIFSPSLTASRPIETLLVPPAAPLSGFSSLLPPYGVHVPIPTVESQYRAAVSALSERLGTDKWFLGSEAPTALDALVFAYLHTILHAQDSIRIEVTKRVNLVAWEWRVRTQVSAAFHPC